MSKLTVNDLTTDDHHIIRGVNWQRKNKVEHALKLKKSADRAIAFIKENHKSIKKLIQNEEVLNFFIGVLMYSQKSLYYIPKKEIIRQIKMNLKPERFGDDSHLQDLKDFYMMTAGESNGGRMRNLIGKKGNELFCRYIQDYFNENGIDYTVNKNRGNIQTIETNELVIVFNKKPKFIDKSVDFIVLMKDESGNYNIEDPKSYISAGELKSGIDPSGADEHWKTATTALNRVRESFVKNNQRVPDLYFIGGAISKHMAMEIIEYLDNGMLQGAANLNEEEQVKNVVNNFLKRFDRKIKKTSKRAKRIV